MEKEHLEIILEDINNKFDFVIEGHQTLNDKMDANHTELKKDIEFVNFKIDALSDKVETVEKN